MHFAKMPKKRATREADEVLRHRSIGWTREKRASSAFKRSYIKRPYVVECPYIKRKTPLCQNALM